MLTLRYRSLRGNRAAKASLLVLSLLISLFAIWAEAYVLSEPSEGDCVIVWAPTPSDNYYKTDRNSGYTEKECDSQCARLHSVYVTRCDWERY